MADRLRGKVALVTGAGAGIGAAIARAFVAEGATVIAADLEDGHVEGAEFARLDVTDEAAWDATVGGILARHGRLDVLVNNAGVMGAEADGPHDPERATLESWRRVHAVNLDGTFLGCRAAIRAMRRTGEGSIVNMSSRSGLVGVPGQAAYASAKAAVRNHTKSVALWCAGQGLKVRCNSVHPAAIDTGMWAATDDGDPTNDSPLGRLGRPEEVAMACVMLASDECAYMTGSEVVIDGGVLAGAGVHPGGD